MNQRQEGSAEFLIPRGHAELLELVEAPLHLIAHLVLLLVRGKRLRAIRPPIRAFGGRPRENDCLNPQCPQNVTAVRGLVPHRNPQPRYRRRQPLPHRLESPRVGALAPAQHERDAGTGVGAGRVQFSGQPPRERPRAWAGCPPFFGGGRRRADEPTPWSKR